MARDKGVTAVTSLRPPICLVVSRNMVDLGNPTQVGTGDGQLDASYSTQVGTGDGQLDASYSTQVGTGDEQLDASYSSQVGTGDDQLDASWRRRRDKGDAAVTLVPAALFSRVDCPIGTQCCHC